MPELPDPSVQAPGRSHWVEGKRGLPSTRLFLVLFPNCDYIVNMPSTLTIRQLTPGDQVEVDRLYEICLRTGDSGADATELYQDPKLIGDIYVGPYARFHPELAYVLVDDTDTIQGYAVGVTDSLKFDALLDQQWWPWLRARYPLNSLAVAKSDKGLAKTIHNWTGTNPEVAANYPAHFHIDLLPNAQGGGHGKRLLVTLLNALRDSGAAGVHFGVSMTNQRATGFYQHLGFTVIERHPWGFIMGMPFTI